MKKASREGQTQSELTKLVKHPNADENQARRSKSKLAVLPFISLLRCALVVRFHAKPDRCLVKQKKPTTEGIDRGLGFCNGRQGP